jgi:hypothetical protein
VAGVAEHDQQLGALGAPAPGEGGDAAAGRGHGLGIEAQHPGQVLTRNQLLDATWGSDVFLTDRIVDVHINNLRKKIEAKPSKPRVLISVRGIGYRFDV